MENKSDTEDIGEIQTYVVTMRNKYCNTLSKYYEQNNKIDLKLLTNRELKSEDKFEIPKDLSLEENLVGSLNDDLLNIERINIIRDKLKNLDVITIQNIRMKNCDIYKRLAADL